MPPREFGKSDARVLARRRHADSGEHVLRPERGFEQAFEEIVRLDRALALRPARLDFAVERQQAGRQFRRRIGEGNGAAERAAVADGDVADMRHGPRDQRRVLRDNVGAFGAGMARQRADFNRVALLRDAIEPIDAIDVDEQAGADSRIFSVAIRLCPPASSRASFCSPNSATACSTERALA